MEILTNFDNLVPSEPIKFITKDGYDRTEIDKVVAGLKETMEANPEMVALAAPAIGMNTRAFCIRFNNTVKTFINPVITKKSGVKVILETCDLLPGKEIVIGRPEEITVVYYTDELKYEENKLLGTAAAIFDQQEQLLNGILPSELGLVSDIETDGAITEEDWPAVFEFYTKTFLPAKLEAVKELIGTDEESAKAYKELAFTEGVINGRIKVVESEAETSARGKAKKAAAKSLRIAGMQAAHQQRAEFKSYVNKVSKKKKH